MMGEIQTGGTAPCNAYSSAAFWDLHRAAAANDVVWASMLYNGSLSSTLKLTTGSIFGET